jgi:hypothetical protein
MLYTYKLLKMDGLKWDAILLYSYNSFQETYPLQDVKIYVFFLNFSSYWCIIRIRFNNIKLSALIHSVRVMISCRVPFSSIDRRLKCEVLVYGHSSWKPSFEV